MNSKSLISLVDESSQLEKALIESGGEVTPELEALIEAKEIHLPHKVDNYAMLMDRMDTISAFYKEKAQMYLALAKSAESLIDKCSYNLKVAMQATGEEEIKGVDMRFKLVASNPKCVIEDESLVDAMYKVTEMVTTVDKKKITEDLKIGVPVPGAKLERGVSLRRYNNTPAISKKRTSNG